MKEGGGRAGLFGSIVLFALGLAGVKMGGWNLNL